MEPENYLLYSFTVYTLFQLHLILILHPNSLSSILRLSHVALNTILKLRTGPVSYLVLSNASVCIIKLDSRKYLKRV
jgi:hypothetical protein